ncbi:peptidylprolyl isomerase [Sorangium cellulosum]|nr:peptidylprolyl isomerase [Sorangium cellulosum]
MIARTLAMQPVAALAALAVLAGCSKTPEPTAEESPKTKTTTPASTGAAGSKTEKTEKTEKERPPPQRRKVSAKPVAEVKPSEDDPVKGKWTLEDATKGLPPGKTLTASIETDLGTLSCKLFDDKAPITVANFVGLARGIRPWKTPEGKWEKKPAYDGTIFHRIIQGFMIQGGDAKKNGTGEAGYVIPDEVWEDGSHDRPGLLCMANRGKNTNSAQFFITDAAAFHLDNGYTIFGECGPEELVHKLAGVEVKGERPVTPPVIKKVTITRQ